MAYITKDNLATNVYPEIIDTITRTNDSIVDEAIQAGIDEATSYMNRFNLLAIFGTDTQPPTYSNKYLDRIIKNIICWHLVILANPNVNVDIARLAYTDAIKGLTKAMDGDTDPGWPLRIDVPTLIPGEYPHGTIGGENIHNGIDLSGNISWNSNRRRSSHW